MPCCVSVWSWKILVSCLRVARLFSVIGTMMVAGDRFWRAVTRSAEVAIAMFFEPGIGMTALMEVEANMLLTRSALVSQTHTW